MTQALIYILLAPILGGLLAGVDRKITARMQHRAGPPILQPFYDLFKLFSKSHMEINRYQFPFMVTHLLLMIFAGALFFSGGSFLLVLFIFTAASLFLILAAYTANSPFSFVGAQRELVILLAAEPIFILTIFAIYKVSGAHNLLDLFNYSRPLIYLLPGICFAFIFMITMKFRKSPFDISTSHHAHQEIVKGLTTDLSGPMLGIIELSHWYESIFLLGFIFLFFHVHIALGILITLFIYFLEILVDNTNARATYGFTLTSTWGVTLIAGLGNLIVIYLLF